MKQCTNLSVTDCYLKPTPEQIALAAYHLYLENGCRDGYDLEDWLLAEAMLTPQMEEFQNVPVFEPARMAVSQGWEIPVHVRELPVTRDQRASASREEIQQDSTRFWPVDRQPQRRTERITHSESMARSV